MPAHCGVAIDTMRHAPRTRCSEQIAERTMTPDVRLSSDDRHEGVGHVRAQFPDRRSDAADRWRAVERRTHFVVQYRHAHAGEKAADRD